MAVPIGKDVEIPVRVFLVGDPLAVVGAALLRVGEASLTLRVDPPTTAWKLGRRAVITVGDEKLAGRIAAIEGPIATIAREETLGSDDRGAPRVRAPIRLRWWSDGDTSAFLAGNPPATPGEEVAGEDVSLSGVRFTTGAAPAVGARILLEADLEDGASGHRMVAIVRRVDGGRVGAEFADMREGTFDALCELTLRNL